MINETPISLHAKIDNVQLMIHWSFGPSFYHNKQVVYRMTGIDDFGNGYTGLGVKTLFGELVVSKINPI